MMMHFRSALLALSLPLALAACATPMTADRAPENRLAKALHGFEAGQPVRCIYLRDIRSSRIFERTAILYDMGGGLLYVNRPHSGASSLHQGDVMVTDTHSPQLCDVDIVRLYDSGTRMQSGSVGLGQFIPYRKVRAQGR
jgi:hypothetical protein